MNEQKKTKSRMVALSMLLFILMVLNKFTWCT
jgi:hypothetical protein